MGRRYLRVATVVGPKEKREKLANPQTSGGVLRHQGGATKPSRGFDWVDRGSCPSPIKTGATRGTRPKKEVVPPPHRIEIGVTS